jgi:hypothetical protein
MEFHVSSSPLLENRRVFTERGPSMLNWLVALPPLVVGMASQGFAFILGVVLAVGWLILLPAAAYLPRSVVALMPPIFAGAVFVTTLLFVPYSSAAFWVYAWTSLGMLLMTVPKVRRDHWEERVEGREGNRNPIW